MIDRLRPIARCVAVVLAIALLGACASKGTIVLLPETDGKPTAVTVRQADKEVVLDRPYAAAKVASQGLDPYQSNPQEVETQFGKALAAQAIRAETFVLYFVEGKDEFTDESKRLVDRVLAEVARRPVPDVLVVGHTDTVGTDQRNDALGLRRAETVRAALIALGVPASDVQASSRGKRAPAVPTADGVAEPRNRRVEIVVR
jgi:outer membrane protein OmpA-like peptidoglycan-associated protein